jgi:hypothetical protein
MAARKRRTVKQRAPNERAPAQPNPVAQWADAWRAVAASQARAKRAGASDDLLERERARALGIPFDEPERARARVLLQIEPRAIARALDLPEPAVERAAKKPRARRKPEKPPKAISVLTVGKRFDDAARAVDFARANQLPPREWSEDLADWFDLDVHDLYAQYYDTDPALQAAA